MSMHFFWSCLNIQLPVALLSSVACELAPLRIVLLCVCFTYFLFFYFSFWYVYRLQWLCTTEEHFWTLDNATLTWFRTLYPRIQRGHWKYLRNNVLNNDHLNNRRRRRKHRGRRAGIRNRLRKRAHSPPLPSILLANVQSLENNMDDLRARISFQRDIRDCNIFVWPKRGSRRRSRTPL